MTTRPAPTISSVLDVHLPRVTNLSEAAEFAHQYPAIITAGPWPDEVQFGHPNHHIETFRDVTHGNSGPTLRIVERMLTFARANPGPILVHCRKGKRRSTATAWGILIDQGVNPFLAFEVLKQSQPQDPNNRRVFRPNRKMVLYLEKIFDCTGLVEYSRENEDKYPNEYPVAEWL